MKLVKAKVYNLTIENYTFPVMCLSVDRAYDFFKAVFPDRIINISDIKKVEKIYLLSTLESRFKQIKQTWADMNLLQASPGSIQFNKQVLDLLLDNTQIILTNI